MKINPNSFGSKIFSKYKNISIFLREHKPDFFIIYTQMLHLLIVK